MTRLRRRPTMLLSAVALVAALLGSLATVSTSSAFTARVTNNTNTAATAAYFTCLAADKAPGAQNTFFLYPPSDASSPAVVDASGNGNSGALAANVSVGAAGSGPCKRDSPNRSFTLSGSNNDGYISGPNVTQDNPTIFTVGLWFKTTTTKGGKLIGFDSNRTGASGQYDRHIYMDNSGKLWFGVYVGGTKTVTTPGSYNDGTWHLATVTLSAAGIRLYVDGKVAATDPATKTGEPHVGYWRIGWGNLGGWPSRPSSDYFNGSVAFPAVYTVALTDTQISAQYTAGR